MNYAIVKKDTKELLAYLSDDGAILRGDVEVINYGKTDPVFADCNGKVYVQPNTFTIDVPVN